MNIPAISGNVQAMDMMPAVRSDKVVAAPDAGSMNSGFASSMQQSQADADQRIDDKTARANSTDMPPSSPGREQKIGQHGERMGGKQQAMTMVSRHFHTGQVAEKSTGEAAVSSPDDSKMSMVDDSLQKPEAVVKNTSLVIAFLAMVDEVGRGSGSAKLNSEMLQSQQVTVEGQPASGTSALSPRAQLSIEQLARQVVANAAPQSGGETAEQIAALLGSLMNGGTIEDGGALVPNALMEEQSVLGTSQLSSREQLSIEQLVQQVVANATNQANEKSGTQMETTIASVLGEEMVLAGHDAENVPAAGKAAGNLAQQSELIAENIFSGKDTVLSVSQVVPEQLTAVAGDKEQFVDNQPPHEQHDDILENIFPQKNAVTKKVFHQFPVTLDQPAAEQKSAAEQHVRFGLSELSAGRMDNAQVAANGVDDKLSGLPLPGLEPVAGKNANHLPLSSDDVLRQVTMSLPDRTNSRQVVTIQLQPESLGKVEIKLVMEQQKLSAHFVVQHSEVRDVLLKQVTSLHDALVAKGVEVKHVAVEIAPAEKMAGMSVNVDQHAAGGNLSHHFQQFSSGSDQRQHSFSAQSQRIISPVGIDEEPSPVSPTSAGLSLQPGYLHIRA